MSSRPNAIALLSFGAGLLLSGCGIYHRHGLDAARARQIEATFLASTPTLTREREDQILALNPVQVSARDVREVLAGAPAPHLFNIHGGLARVIPRMVNFSHFLIGMGYPGQSITNPSDGTYSFSCYESAGKIAGVMAWYYERDGLRPMLNGHSQGAMQVVKVLYRLAGDAPLQVWNPLTWMPEPRCEITDPLTGQVRPVAGLEVCFSSSLGGGGLTRVLPNQWEINCRLRRIPDSAVEFLGFCKQNDLLGGDYLGYGPANHYRATGRAAVRNVWLPKEYKHGEIPNTEHLLQSQPIRDWLDAYQPSDQDVSHPQLDAQFDADSAHILWAAEMWYRIKKHWVLELQRLIRAKRASRPARRRGTFPPHSRLPPLLWSRHENLPRFASCSRPPHRDPSARTEFVSYLA